MSIFSKYFKVKAKKEGAIKKQVDLDRKLVFSLSKTRLPTLRQLKYLPRYLGRQEKLILAGFLITVFASVIFLGFRFFLSEVEIVPASGGEYAEGLVGSPQYVNPILAQTNDVDMDLSRLIFSGLFQFNERGELVPDLATRYEISEDKKSYTISLRENIFWHDGEKFSADDVVFTVTSIKDPLWKSPLYTSFKGVEIEKLDDKTIRFKLSEAYAPFLGLLTFGILPEHVWYNVPPQSANLAEYNIKPIGSGPFVFKSLSKDKNGIIKVYTLAKNDNFYRQKPFLDKLVFKFYPDFETALEALQNKNIEGISFLPEELKSSLQSKWVKKYLLNLPQYTALFFNQKNNDALKDLSVRKALAQGINKTKLVEEIFGQEGKIIYGPIPPGYVGYLANFDKDSFDQTAAAELLEKAGYKLDGSIRKKEDKILKIVLSTADRPEYKEVIEAIKKDWEAIGVQVDLQIMPGTQLQREVIRPRNYEALILGMVLGFDPDPFSVWHSSQVEAPGLNLAQYANRKADKLLEEARQTENRDERAGKYIEFQNILAEDIPAIFLYTPCYTYAVSEAIKGINVLRINVPSDRFAGIENWYRKTKKQWR